METIVLNATKRTDIGRNNFAARAEGQIPAVVYGSDIQPQSVSVESSAFSRTLRSAGESTIVDLTVEGTKEPIKVLIQDVQRDPVRSNVIHVDFRQVNMLKLIEAKIPLNFIGDSAAVHALGGTLIKSLEEIEVRCLPSKLVHQIDIDVSVLKTFEDAIHVSDLVVPEGMEILTEGNYTLATVEAPRSEAEMAALDAAVEVDVTAVEVEKKGKEEEAAEGAEGEAPAEGGKKE
ncbi:MAG: 50S ribosomal protein L25 [Patescibacteria group bacterium]